MEGARPMRSTRRLQNLTSTLPKWWRIQNAATPDKPTVISIYDEIGFFGCDAQQFMDELSGIDGDLELHINSPGGDIFHGVAIHNQLKQREGQIRVVIDGLAASAASFIAQAASPGCLEIAPHATMMIHNGFGQAIGDAKDMRKMADLLDQQTQNIANVYAKRTGKPVDYWLGKMAEETWYVDHEAVAEGLADKVSGEDSPETSWDLSVFSSWPGQEKPKKGKKAANKDYKKADRDRMAKSGEAMEDGSYPIADEEDLHNAIRAVGRGGSDHDAIRAHIIKRAKALGLSSAIPDNWNGDGSLKAADSIDTAVLCELFTNNLAGSKNA